MNDKWMNDLRELVDRFEKNPPKGLLDDVRREMAARGFMPSSSKHRARIVPMATRRRFAAAIVAAAVVGGATLMWVNHDHNSQPTAAISQTNNNPTAGTNPTANAASSLAVAETTQSAVPTASQTAPQTHGATSGTPQAALQQRGTAAQSPLLAKASTVETNRTAPQTAPAAMAEKSEGAAATTEQKTESREQPSDNSAGIVAQRPAHPQPRRGYATAEPYAPAKQSQKESNDWEFGGYLAGLTPTGAVQASDMQPMMYDNYYNDSNEGLAPLSHCSSKMFATANVEPEVNEVHHRPVKIGFSVKYHLGGRFDLLSGLTYSRLTSEISENYYVSEIQTTQKLHYIGLPVSLSYSIWQTPRFNVYVLGGGAIEKLVKGKATINTSDDNGTRSLTETITERQPVFSTHAAAGVEYQPMPYFSIFVEPGVEHHFKNGSPIHSSYTDKPTSFNLNLGLRMKLK